MLPLLRTTSANELSGKRVFLRLDLNVPVTNAVIADDFRILKVLPTIQFLKNAGAHLVIASHLGEDGSASIAPIADYLAPHLDSGDTVLPNLRTNPGEMNNDPAFAQELAAKADIFVNEAFSVSHRAHASIVGVPKLLPSYAGLLFEQEVQNLSRAFKPEHPFFVVLGGAKFETKIPLIKKFIAIGDEVFVSGALCIDFFHALGYETGLSARSSKAPDLADMLRHPKIRLPSDLLVTNVAGDTSVKDVKSVRPDETIVDMGPDTIRVMSESAQKSAMVLWNGPLGLYEKGFPGGTDDFASALCFTKAFEILGGGDTVASIRKLNILDSFGFVSTGGGAMLEFLANETLPGIEALKK